MEELQQIEEQRQLLEQQQREEEEEEKMKSQKETDDQMQDEAQHLHVDVVNTDSDSIESNPHSKDNNNQILEFERKEILKDTQNNYMKEEHENSTNIPGTEDLEYTHEDGPTKARRSRLFSHKVW